MGNYMRDFMTEQDATQPRVFDFNKAVEEAKRDYPKETKDIVFLDTSAPDFHDKLLEFAKLAKLNNIQLDSILERAGRQEAIATEMNGFQVMAIPSQREAAKGQFPDDQYKSAYFCFQHELGHFVVPQAHKMSSTKSTEWREHAADFFAITRGIQAGVFDKKDVVDQANSRAMATLLAFSDITHLTTMTLDAMAINPKNIDFLSLSKQEIKEVAAKHATVFELDTKPESQFSQLMNLGKERGQRTFTDDDQRAAIVGLRLLALVEMCQDAPSNSQAFYLSARILDKVIEQGGVKNGDLKIDIDTKTPEWQKVKDMIAEKVGDRDIGAKKALETSSFTKPRQEEEKAPALVSLVRRIAPKPLKI